MDGRAHVDGRIGAVQKAHRTGKDVAARHIVRAQVQPGGQDDVARQRQGHAAEQRQAQPPEVFTGRLPQQEEQGEGDPREPCKVGDDGIFAEGDQIVQAAVHQHMGHVDLGVQKIECREI